MKFLYVPADVWLGTRYPSSRMLRKFLVVAGTLVLYQCNTSIETSLTMPKVRFQDPNGRAAASPPLSHIQSICNSLQQSQDQQLKIYLCKQRLSRRLHPPRLTRNVCDRFCGPTEKLITLNELLTTTGVSWQLKNRTTLAFELASSLLQLHSTPWLPEFWNKVRVSQMPPLKGLFSPY